MQLELFPYSHTFTNMIIYVKYFTYKFHFKQNITDAIFSSAKKFTCGLISHQSNIWYMLYIHNEKVL